MRTKVDLLPFGSRSFLRLVPYNVLLRSGPSSFNIQNVQLDPLNVEVSFVSFFRRFVAFHNNKSLSPSTNATIA